ncbi:MAG: hypothetical protein WA989_06240 [Henriciella sp.]|uniref:hypothetical protein n=1 Tax=Henriciella sp. TaxID=1968823 RepID=UPI003C7183B7
MNRASAILAASALLATACADETAPAGPADPTPEYKQSIDEAGAPPEEVAETNPQALKIGVMHAPRPDAYCTLMQASHEFVFDDRSTWRFVFLTDMEGDPQPATIRINEEDLRFFEEMKTENGDGIETWRYRSEDRSILVELQLRAVDSGIEHTDYEGTMAIIEPVETEKMGIKGSCGV